MSRNEQAKGIQRAEGSTGQPLDGLSPSLTHEARGLLERALRVHKAETLAGVIDRKRSTIYAYAASGEVPLPFLPILAEFDPDPESLSRIAGHLLAHVAQRAILRRAQGSAFLILEEFGPGKVARR